MSVTFPSGVARQANRAILTATLIFGGVGLTALVFCALARPGANATVPSVVYGACLAICSLCSFLYNMREATRWRKLLRYLDHAAIFLLIAGTYTPFAVTGIRGPLGLGLLQWVWALALLGMVLKLVLPAAYDRLFVGVYLAIGWLFIWAAGEIIEKLPALPLGLLAAGGVIYTLGAIVYARDIGRWTDPVWHSCVLAGGVAHFLAVVALLFPA